MIRREILLLAAMLLNVAFIIFFNGCQRENPLTSSPTEQDKPSYRVGVFYYPWYEIPETDGQWGHWEGGTKYQPPLDISSDYYPVLGAYSSVDTSVVGQHFRWLRAARVGVVICSWWGQGDYTDGALVFYDVTDATFIDKGHFDGLYNYATVAADPDFAWAEQLPSQRRSE